jgi:hypothetical protein
LVLVSLLFRGELDLRCETNERRHLGFFLSYLGFLGRVVLVLWGGSLKILIVLHKTSLLIIGRSRLGTMGVLAPARATSVASTARGKDDSANAAKTHGETTTAMLA